MVSVILLLLLFKLNKIDFKVLISDIKNADRVFLVLGFACLPLVHLLSCWRWHMLLKVAEINISLKKLISSFCGGIFFSIFLPSTIGGDLVRTADLAKNTQKTKKVIATVFLDRLSGYIGLVLVVLPAILLGSSLIGDKIVYFSVAVIVMILVVALVLLFNTLLYEKISRLLSVFGSGRIIQLIKEMHREIHVFRNHKKMIVANLVLSFIIQLIFPLGVYFTGLSLGVNINIFYFMYF